MRVPNDVVEREWHVALRDAEIEVEDVALWPCDGFHESSGEAPACCYPEIRGVGSEDPFLPALQRAGHDLECEDRPRVALFLDFLDPATDTELPIDAMVAGLLRHELEHVKQFSYWIPRGIDLYELDGHVDRMLETKAENCGALYNAKPTENDANAAASRHLYRRHGAARNAIHAAQRFPELARYPVGPEAMETLVPRLVAFGLLIRSQLDTDAASRNETAGDVIERYGRGATGQLWTDLTQVVNSWRPEPEE